MRLSTLGLSILTLVFVAAFWEPLVALWDRIATISLFRGMSPIDVMVFIALALLAIRVFIGPSKSAGEGTSDGSSTDGVGSTSQLDRRRLSGKQAREPQGRPGKGSR